MPPVTRIALTGGAVSGKTSACEKLKEHFEKKGYVVCVVAEAATILINGGLDFSELYAHRAQLSFDFVVETQALMLSTVIHLEDTMMRVAEMRSAATGKPALVLCDRGVLDGAAFCNNSAQWQQVIGDQSSDNLLKRYNACIHLVSTAVDAVDVFERKKGDNPARSIVVASQAAALDQRLQRCYENHPVFHFVTNAGFASFEERLEDVIEIVESVLAKCDG